MKLFLMLAACLLAGCTHSKLTSYDLKGLVGQTEYDAGVRALYTGAEVNLHFEVK